MFLPFHLRCVTDLCVYGCCNSAKRVCFFHGHANLKIRLNLQIESYMNPVQGYQVHG